MVGGATWRSERAVGATETKRVGQHVFQSHRTGVLGNVVEIAALARLIQVDGRRRHLEIGASRWCHRNQTSWTTRIPKPSDGRAWERSRDRSPRPVDPG